LLTAVTKTLAKKDNGGYACSTSRKCREDLELDRSERSEEEVRDDKLDIKDEMVVVVVVSVVNPSFFN